MKMKNAKWIAGVAVGTAALFSFCAVAPASAVNNIKGFGVQETLKDFYSLGTSAAKSVTP